MTYRPASSQVTLCGTFRSDSVSVTRAPGMTPPLTSVTTPRTEAVYDDCARATPANPSAMHNKEIARRRLRTFPIAPPRLTAPIYCTAHYRRVRLKMCIKKKKDEPAQRSGIGEALFKRWKALRIDQHHNA